MIKKRTLQEAVEAWKALGEERRKSPFSWLRYATDKEARGVLRELSDAALAESTTDKVS